MKILLGSTNDDKADILRTFLNDFDEVFEIIKCDVSSGITNQPLDEKITIKGAINRAKNALSTSHKADLAIGLESGLEEISNNDYYLVCAAVLANRAGDIHIGISSKLRLPKKVSERIKNGEPFGIVIREYQNIHKSDKSIQPVISSLISREKVFIEAIKNAFLSYQNSLHYK